MVTTVKTSYFQDQVKIIKLCIEHTNVLQLMITLKYKHPQVQIKIINCMHVVEYIYVTTLLKKS